ncbi:hypothetical protein JXR93_10900 [bacterium]|nr:hypothetical protein [bacterium]
MKKLLLISLFFFTTLLFSGEENSVSSKSIQIDNNNQNIYGKTADFSVSKSDGLTQTLNISIETDDFQNDYDKLMSIIKETDGVTFETNQAQYYRSKNIKLHIWFSKENFYKAEKKVKKIGYTKYQNLTTTNNANQNEILEMELEHTIQKKISYEKQLERLESNQDLYLSFWNTIKDLEDKIFQYRKTLKQNKQQNEFYILIVDLDEKHSEPMDSFEFINMPGVEYNYFHVDTPKKELSSKKYHGAAIRYMFSKGKSYIILNVMKTLDKISSENKTEIQEIFTYAYGVDFYPKYLGSGRRMFLNLFSGFSFGGAYFTADSNTIHTFQVTAHLGLELLKTNYVLWDIKAGYFLPFNENRNFRGYLFTSGINFMF